MSEIKMPMSHVQACQILADLFGAWEEVSDDMPDNHPSRDANRYRWGWYNFLTGFVRDQDNLPAQMGYDDAKGTYEDDD